jgi:hypothetical protein
MSAFSVMLQVWNPAQPGEIEELSVVVDLHSTFSWISRARLERLGISPSRKMRFRLKGERIVERDVASVYIALLDGPVGDLVVMAEAGEMERMGAHTIDGLGMVVDPVQRKLVPTVMWALSSIGIAVPEIMDKDPRALARS